MPNREPEKILELNADDWMEGISYQPSLTLGGIFQAAPEFNPFIRAGHLTVTEAAFPIGATTITAAGLHNVGFQETNIGYFYSFANNTIAYKVQTLTPFTVSVVSAGITNMAAPSGATAYKSKIIYANTTSVLAGAVPLNAGTQVQILTGLDSSSQHQMVIGPDRNLYIANENHVAKITNVDGTTGNVAQHLTFEDDVRIRAIDSDGKYLIIIADTAASYGQGAITSERCFVAFWNMKSQDLTRIWEFRDTQIFSGRWSGEDVVVFGADNVYTCRIDTPIEPTIPLKGYATLANAAGSVVPSACIRFRNAVYFGMGVNLFAYGRELVGVKKILYHPHIATNGNIVSLFSDGRSLFAMTSTNKCYRFTTETTSSTNSTTFILSEIPFERPFEFAYAKILLRSRLVSGQRVELVLRSHNGSNIILNQEGMRFDEDGDIASKFVTPEGAGTSNDTSVFEDFYTMQIQQTGCQVRRISIYGYPVKLDRDI